MFVSSNIQVLYFGDSSQRLGMIVALFEKSLIKFGTIVLASSEGKSVGSRKQKSMAVSIGLIWLGNLDCFGMTNFFKKSV